jgi:hypothetical protein
MWSKVRGWAEFDCTQSEPRMQTLSLGRTAYFVMLMLTWGRLLKGELFILMSVVVHERHAVRRGIWEPTQYLL